MNSPPTAPAASVPLTAAEYNAAPGNNITGAGATENVKLTDSTVAAFPPLIAPKTINALVNAAAVSANWAMGNTLTVTSGQFIHTSSATFNISSGTLTAGTGTPGAVDLDFTTSGNTVTLAANLTNNGSTVVSLVKNGAAPLTLSNTTNSTFSGGTVVNEGTLRTGSTANLRYLGSGPVIVQNAASLTLNAPGATSFAGSAASPTYSVKSGGSVLMATAPPTANEFFKLESGAVIGYGTFTVSAGLDLTTNLNAAPGAIFAEGTAGANAALKLGGVPIQSALTTPTYYFGTATLNLQDNITVGQGTPWLGLSNHGGSTSYGGASASNNTITANSDFTFFAANASSAILTIGGGASATNIIKIATPNGNVTASVVGTLSLNNDHSQFGSGGNTVTFRVTPGSSLLGLQANAQGVIGGAAIAPARIVVENGGELNLNNPAALNGPVTLLPGATFNQNQATLTGTGTITHSPGSVLNLTLTTAAVSGATQQLGTVPGTIIRMTTTGLLPGTSTNGVTQFDSRLDDAAVYVLLTPMQFGAASSATDSLFTLSAANGIGGVLTNDGSVRTLSATTGVIAIGPGGGTFAATTGTLLNVAENFSLGSNVLTIGSGDSLDGHPKAGPVTLSSAANSNTGAAGSRIDVVSGVHFFLSAGDQIPDATTIRTTGQAIFNLVGFSDTVGGLIVDGGIVTGTTGVLTSTTAFELRSGGVLATLAGPVGLNKSSGLGITVYSANTYSGDTVISEGSLNLTSSGSIANSPNIVVAAGATLGVANVTGGANHDGTRFALASGQTLRGTGTVDGAMSVSAGAAIAPGNSIGTLAIDSLSLTSANSIFELEIDFGLTPAADLLDVTGGITLTGSTLDLSLFNLSPMNLPETFLFAMNDLNEPVNGSFGTVDGLPDGYVATVDYAFSGTDALGRNGDGNDLAVTFSLAAVPEPGTVAWGAAVSLLSLGWRRRSRR